MHKNYQANLGQSEDNVDISAPECIQNKTTLSDLLTTARRGK
jgi:hypothetical protein